MVQVMPDPELSALLELEPEMETFFESEWETGDESEAFFRRLKGLARRAAASPTLRRLGMRAAQSVLRSGALGSAGNLLGGLLQEGEGEDWMAQEFEWEWDGELETNPVRRIYPDAPEGEPGWGMGERLYPDALMEHLGHAAADAESDDQAEAFIGALVPLAAQLLPRVLPTMAKAAPTLIRGASQVAKFLRSSPTIRPLVRTLPTIVRGTVTDLARQVGKGQPLTAQGALRTLARRTAGVLSSPQRCAACYQRSRRLDRRYHRHTGA